MVVGRGGVGHAVEPWASWTTTYSPSSSSTPTSMLPQVEPEEIVVVEGRMSKRIIAANNGYCVSPRDANLMRNICIKQPVQ